MKTIASSALSTALLRVLDQVSASGEPFLVTRQGGQPVVMMSPEDHHALEETAVLLQSPENARRLLNSIQELEQGLGRVRELSE